MSLEEEEEEKGKGRHKAKPMKSAPYSTVKQRSKNLYDLEEI
jgi:hypothetical protein